MAETSSPNTGLVKSDLMESLELAQKDEVVSSMKSQMKASMHNNGPTGSVRHTILLAVTEEKYDMAISRLNELIESKPEYPEFRQRCERYVNYAIELIQAIRVKRSFPGWNALNMSKQKELFERALHHFEDLKATLIKVEIVEKEVRIEDVRSTVWVIKAVVFAVSALLIVAFIREVSGGVLPAAGTVIESTTSHIVDYVFDKFKL